MRFHNRLRSILFLLLVLPLSLLIACGGGGGGSSDESVAVPPTTDPSLLDLPSDPGEAGLQALAGIDSDLDGVRDDLQIYIANRFADRKTDRDALMQIAIALQGQLAPNQTEAQYIAAANKVLRAVGCYLSVQSATPIEQRSTEISLLQAKVLNTSERLGAYRSFDAAVGGQVFTLLPLDQQISSCEFNVD